MSKSESSDDDLEEIVRPIESITITVPPEDCEEVGAVKYIVETLGNSKDHR